MGQRSPGGGRVFAAPDRHQQHSGCMAGKVRRRANWAAAGPNWAGKTAKATLDFATASARPDLVAHPSRYGPAGFYGLLCVGQRWLFSTGHCFVENRSTMNGQAALFWNSWSVRRSRTRDVALTVKQSYSQITGTGRSTALSTHTGRWTLRKPDIHKRDPQRIPRDDAGAGMVSAVRMPRRTRQAIQRPFPTRCRICGQDFKVASPSTLPVEQPTKFTLVVNLRAAKTLGLAISYSVLLQADEVIRWKWESTSPSSRFRHAVQQSRASQRQQPASFLWWAYVRIPTGMSKQCGDSISAFDEEAVQRKRIREPSAVAVSLYCQSGRACRALPMHVPLFSYSRSYPISAQPRSPQRLRSSGSRADAWWVSPQWLGPSSMQHSGSNHPGSEREVRSQSILSLLNKDDRALPMSRRAQTWCGVHGLGRSQIQLCDEQGPLSLRLAQRWACNR